MSEEKILYKATLVFLIRDGKVLLATKMKKIGAGCRNAHGGGIEPGESAIEAAVREVEEEANVAVTADKLQKLAVVDFHNQTIEGKDFTCRVHCFVTTSWQGEVQATPEMADPQWFDIGNLPFDQMMPADRAWLPRMLACRDSGIRIYAEAWYGPFQKELLRPVEIKEVDVLPEL